MKKQRNILLLADYLPDSGWGGGVIIRSLLENIPDTVSIKWTTYSRRQNEREAVINNIKIIPFKPRYIRGQGKFNLIRKLDSLLFSADFNTILKTHDIDLLWIVCGVTYNELYRLNTLVSVISIPYHITVHDDPIEELTPNQKAEGTNLFRNILQKARTVDVISERMRQNYLRSYGTESIVITRGIPDNFPTNTSRVSGVVNILMGGFGNVSEPWPAPLIETVHLLNKSIQCHLHLFDYKLNLWSSEHVHVYKNLPEASFNEILKTTHIGYACDDLHPSRLAFAQLSLPTKVITYIGAGIPFVYHGPKDSTVADLLAEYEAGIIVDTNNSDDLYEAFTKLLSNYNYYQQNCRSALERMFASSIVQNRFYHYLLDN